jgi:NAD-dependent deacetylase sirtuin 4
MRTAIMSALQLTFITPLTPSRRPFSTTTRIAASGYRLTRDRIGSDGHLQPETPEILKTPPQTASHPNYVIGSPIPNAQHPAPNVPPPTASQLESLAEFITSADKGSGEKGVLIITGAGCSTESNVPDYRGPAGAYSTGFKPMTHQNFMASPHNRSRYWARSFAGWPYFSSVQPNAAHEGIAALETAGFVGHVVTQNVDRLHHKAGSTNILELHGTTHDVICMSCRSTTPRDEVQRWLSQLNPSFDTGNTTASGSRESEEEKMRRAGTTLPLGVLERDNNNRTMNLREAGAGVIRPDGDVELPQYSTTSDNRTVLEKKNSTVVQPEFITAPCPACGGILKPDVVFFGDSLPPKRSEMALDMAKNASRILVVGSSLAVWSAYRLIKTAKEQQEKSGREVKVAVVNVGPTRADEMVDLKLEVRAGDAMTGLKDLLLL